MSTPDRLGKAKKLAQAGDTAGAKAVAKAAIASQPGLEEAYLLLGSLCGLEGDDACAAQSYEQGLAALPRSAAIHHAEGMRVLEKGELPKAIGLLERAHALADEKLPEIAADLAYAYLFIERLDDALRLATEARKSDPQSFASAYTQGEALFKKEQWGAAAAAFRAAMEISPDDALAPRRLGATLSSAGKTEEALAVYESLITRGPKDPRVLVAAARALIELRRPRDAIDRLKSALELAPDNPQLLGLLLSAQEQGGETAAAAETQQRILTLEEKDEP